MSYTYDSRIDLINRFKRTEWEGLLKSLENNEFFHFVFMFPGYRVGFSDEDKLPSFRYMFGALYKYYKSNDIPNKVDIASKFQNEIINGINHRLFVKPGLCVYLYRIIIEQKYNQENGESPFLIDVDYLCKLYSEKFHEKEEELKNSEFLNDNYKSCYDYITYYERNSIMPIMDKGLNR